MRPNFVRSWKTNSSSFRGCDYSGNNHCPWGIKNDNDHETLLSVLADINDKWAVLVGEYNEEVAKKRSAKGKKRIEKIAKIKN